MRDTFLANRYFDVFVEYAKANSEDILCRITAINRGPDPAPIHILPHLWYRNVWTWEPGVPRPTIKPSAPARLTRSMKCSASAGGMCGRPIIRLDLLFTENETNVERL